MNSDFFFVICFFSSENVLYMSHSSKHAGDQVFRKHKVMSHMGRFPQDGKSGCFVSLFKKLC